MPTRRDLHDQARQEQRHRLVAAKVDNPKPAIVGIGARDPQTGLHDVRLPDGSVEAGEKVFSSSLPQGCQVLGVPKETGGWVLDERDTIVSPAPAVVEEPTGKIKYLYAVLNVDGSQDLWVGGWQQKPVRVKAIAPDDRLFSIKNIGSSKYLIDYITLVAGSTGFIATTLKTSNVLYQVTFGNGAAAFSFGSSYFVQQDEFAGNTWRQLFKGAFLGTLPAFNDDFGVLIKPAIPNVIPSFVDNGQAGQVGTGGINVAGTQGVGAYLRGTIRFVALFGATSGVTYTNARITFPSNTYLARQTFDCFDTNFSAIDTATFGADVFSKPKFAVKIGLFNFSAAQQSTVKTTVYGIPTAQRGLATLIGRPSYHP